MLKLDYFSESEWHWKQSLLSDPKSGQHQHPNLCYITEQEKCWVTQGQGLTLPFTRLQVPKQQGGWATITHHNIFSWHSVATHFPRLQVYETKRHANISSERFPICFLLCKYTRGRLYASYAETDKKLTRRSEGYWHEKKWESDWGRGASFNRAWGAGLSRFFPWKASASALDACCFIMMRLWDKCSQAYLISSKHVLNKSFYSCHYWWMCSASKASWDRSKHRDLVLFLKDLHAKIRQRNKPSVQPLGARLPHVMHSFWCNIYR